MKQGRSDVVAVTVDWVVLTAALVGLGLATMTVVSSGVEDVSADIESQLGKNIIQASFFESRGVFYSEVAYTSGLQDAETIVATGGDLNENIGQLIEQARNEIENDNKNAAETIDRAGAFMDYMETETPHDRPTNWSDRQGEFNRTQGAFDTQFPGYRD